MDVVDQVLCTEPHRAEIKVLAGAEVLSELLPSLFQAHVAFDKIHLPAAVELMHQKL